MTKEEIRKQYQQKRMGLSQIEIDSISQIISDTALDSFDFTNKTVSLFLPINRKNELNTYFLLDKLQEKKATIGLPVTQSEEYTLLHIAYESNEQIHENNLGIPEPTKGEMIEPISFDYIFVPFLAIDKVGHRIGYGKGYYDRFLIHCKKECVFIGLHLFDELLHTTVPNEKDIPLHYCITPSKLIKFEKK
jgi:5-formyltetrahydrofolate cyclo-ligase